MAALGATIVLAWRLGVATKWPAAAWVVVGLFLAVVCSLIVLFARDYIRLHHTGA